VAAVAGHGGGPGPRDERRTGPRVLVDEGHATRDEEPRAARIDEGDLRRAGVRTARRERDVHSPAVAHGAAASGPASRSSRGANSARRTLVVPGSGWSSGCSGRHSALSPRATNRDSPRYDHPTNRWPGSGDAASEIGPLTEVGHSSSHALPGSEVAHWISAGTSVPRPPEAARSAGLTDLASPRARRLDAEHDAVVSRVRRRAATPSVALAARWTQEGSVGPGYTTGS
jgi:hypothetical protein